MNHEEVKRRLLKDPKVREAYENPPLPLLIARSVVVRRKELGMTQAELASLMESSQAQVWRIESGQFNPTLKTLAKLEDALGIDLRNLTGSAQGAEYEDFSPSATEQLEEWIEFGVVVMDAESEHAAFEVFGERGIAGIVRRIRAMVEELEPGEVVEVNIREIEEEEKPGEDVGPYGAGRTHRSKMALTVPV